MWIPKNMVSICNLHCFVDFSLSAIEVKSRALKWVEKTQKSLQKWFKNRSKTESKNDRETEPLPESIFDDFGAIWDPQNRPKIDKNGWGTLIHGVFVRDLDEFLTSTTSILNIEIPLQDNFWGHTIWFRPETDPETVIRAGLFILWTDYTTD